MHSFWTTTGTSEYTHPLCTCVWVQKWYVQVMHIKILVKLILYNFMDEGYVQIKHGWLTNLYYNYVQHKERALYYCFLSLHLTIHKPPCSCSFNFLIGTMAVVSSSRNWMITRVSGNKYNDLYINTINTNIYLPRRDEWNTEESWANTLFT